MARKQKKMPQVVSAFQARTQLGQILRRASGDDQERFIVDRRGEPKVVIMGFQDFMKTIAPEPPILAAMRAYAKQKKTNRLSTKTIEREIALARRERAKHAKSSRSA